MTDSNAHDKLRAVFLTALMIGSVMGAGIAFSGSAAAETSGLTLSDNLVKGGEIQVNGSVNANGTVYAFIDVDGDGNYTDGTDTSDFVNVDNYNDDPKYSISLPVPAESGTYKVHVLQNSTLNDGDEGSETKTVQVDADGPAFSDESPTSTVSLADQGNISVTIEDANNSVESISATVMKDGSVINTWKISPDIDDGDGVAYSDNELTIAPGSGSVPALETGEYTVEVSATDTVGNSNATEFSFTVADVSPTAGFASPSEGDVTSDENQTVEATVNDEKDELIDSTVTLDIEGPNDYSYDNTSDVYNNETHTFVVTPDGENISSFADGDYTATVSGENELGYSVTEQLNFSVDTEGPTVDTVKLTDANLNVSDTEKNDEQVVVTFEDSNVDADSISATVSIDGEEETLDNFKQTDTSVFTADLSLDAAMYDGVESDSAVVNVTAATDSVDIGDANTLTNADEEASNATFAIDTDGPSVELVDDDDANNGEFSGYMNITSLVESTDDESDRTVEILVEGTDVVAANITDDASDYDTRALPDGDYTLKVSVEDDSGNTAYAKEDFTLDNGNAVDVQQKFLAGAVGDSVSVDGKLDLSEDVFSVEGDVAVDYEINGVDSQKFNANDYENYETVTLSANDVDVTVKVDRLVLEQIKTVGDDKDDHNPTKVQFEFNSELDELNATLTATDGYASEVWTDLLSEGDFKQLGDSAVYQTEIPNDIRDGKFEVAVNYAESDTQKLGTDGVVDTKEIVIDKETPTVTHSEIIDGESDSLTVGVRFSESVFLSDLDSHDISVEGDVADAIGVRPVDPDSGLFTVTFDKEFQTAEAPNITVAEESVTEQYGGTPNSETSTEIHTIVLRLEGGINVVSIPAETGSVDVNKYFDGEEIDSLYEYEGDDSWDSYDADAKENSLSELEGGNAYVVKANEDTKVAINAENVPSDANKQAIQSQDISEGWNLIGHYQEGSQSVEQALAPLGDRTYSIEKGYTGTQVETLETGEGYWLFVEESGLHVPVDYDGMNTEQPTVYNVQVPDSVEDGQAEDVTVSAEVDAPNPVSEVLVSSLVFGQDTVELTDDNGDGVYDADISVDYATDLPHESDVGVRVSAIDIYGNVDEETSIVTATENVAPSISSFSVDNTEGQTVEVSFDSDEQLDSIAVSGTQDASETTLNYGNFTEEGDAESGYTYTAELSSNSDGTFGATLDTAADAAGNDGASSQSDSVTVDTTAPSELTPSASFDTTTDTVNVSISPSEQLDTDNLVVTVENESGDQVGTIDSWTESDGPEYDGSYSVSSGVADETYTVTVSTAQDLAGNDGADGQNDTTDVDTAVLGVSDMSVDASTNNTTVTFNDTVTSFQTSDVDVTINETSVDDGNITLHGATGDAEVTLEITSDISADDELVVKAVADNTVTDDADNGLPEGDLVNATVGA